MDQERFDRLTKALAEDRSRRSVLRGLAGGALGALLGWTRTADSAAQEAASCRALGRRCERGDRCCGGGRCKGRECRCTGATKRCGTRCIPETACCTSGRTGCPAGQVCRQGVCADGGGEVCTPAPNPCGDRTCGRTADSCGNVVTCGTCTDDCDEAGRCVPCAPGKTGCGFGRGCVDLRSDRANCGECGRLCGRAESCVDGRCQAPPEGSVARGGACSADNQCDETEGGAVCSVQYGACYWTEPCDPDGCSTFCLGTADGDGAICADHCDCVPGASCEGGRCRPGEWNEQWGGGA